MSDREFYEALLDRARSVLAKAQQDCRPPDNHDGRCAPHVAKDRVSRLRSTAKLLVALADVADA